MITAEQLANGFALNLRLIQMQVDGLSHADSLIQTPYNINSLNWILGHITVNRDRVLHQLGEAPILDEAQTARYQSDSEPVKGDGEDILTLERLLDVLVLGQTLISEDLGRLTLQDLEKEIHFSERAVPLGEHLFGLYFHDTYHTGQTELLRQVAGKSDKIV